MMMNMVCLPAACCMGKFWQWGFRKI